MGTHSLAAAVLREAGWREGTHGTRTPRLWQFRVTWDGREGGLATRAPRL